MFSKKIIKLLFFSFYLVYCDSSKGNLVEFNFKNHLKSNYWCYANQQSKCLLFFDQKLVVSENGIDKSILYIKTDSVDKKQLNIVIENITSKTFNYSFISMDSIRVKQKNSNEEYLLIRSKSFDN